MPLPSTFAPTARFLGRVGNQAAVSLVASAAAAACLALPSLLGSPGQTPVTTEPTAWVSPVAPDGKIRGRHHDAVGGEGLVQTLSGRGLLTPAAIVMPMNLTWTQPAAEPPASEHVATVQTPDPSPAIVKTAQALPPRRPSTLAEKVRPTPGPAASPLTEPLQLAGAVSEPSSPDAPRPPAAILGRPLPAPVGYVGSAVSGAAGLVGAAGSWTVARAASLVPSL